MRRWLSLAGLAVLAACGTSPALDLRPVSDVRLLSNPEHSFGRNVVTVRSFAMDAEGNRVEIAGAQCRLRSAWFSVAPLVTPGQFVAPNYLQAERFAERGRPPAISGTCTFDGKRVAVRSDPTVQRLNSTDSGVPAYNAQTGQTVTPTTTTLTSRLSSSLPWFYPSISVEF